MCFCWFLAFLVLSVHVVRVAAAETNCTQNPQPIGIALATTTTYGDEYTSSIELYDTKITVLEIIRGEKGWELLK